MKIYFFVTPERDNYQNDAVQLAEGLQELGVEFYGHSDYWQKTPASGDFLFRKDSYLRPEDCDVLVVPYRWFRWRPMGGGQERRLPMPEAICVPRAKRAYITVYLDDNDGYVTPALDTEFRHFDLILRTKYNCKTYNPPNFRPWAIGLENRVIQATKNEMEFLERRKVIYVNYNASHSYLHSSRQRAIQRLHPVLAKVLETWQPEFVDLNTSPVLPQDKILWEQTNKRHSQAYYDRLKSCWACSAFCGELQPPLPWSPKIFEVFGNKAEIQKKFWKILGAIDPRPARIISWDSFRFWETLAAGTVAFHVDLQLHGVELPVMPENWTHYIGVDLRHPKKTVDRLIGDPGCLPRIAEQGRQWAMENYSPKATAVRFMKMVADAWAPSHDAYTHAKSGTLAGCRLKTQSAHRMPARGVAKSLE
jgi:hypothetical protein